MAVRTREELLSLLNAQFQDNNSDEVLAIIEDVTDTITDLETRANGDGTDWKQKYTENDEQWRKRYKERFMSPEPDPPEPDPPEPPKVKTFDELFTTK